MSQTDIECGFNENHRQRIPLNRMYSEAPSCTESVRRQKMRLIFDEYDSDEDGFLNLKELKKIIKTHQCPDMPKGLAKEIMKQADKTGSRKLDFDEFYQLSIEHQWLVKKLSKRYCSLFVPVCDRRNEVPAEESFEDEIDGKYEESMSLCPPPLTMVIFSIVEIALFVVDIVYFNEHKGNNINDMGLRTTGPAASHFIYNPYRRHEAWRFMTYMFVHVGVMHLTMNLIIQIFLGIVLELVHCWWRVAIVYVAGVVAGSIGTSLTSPHIFLAGASGGVYALITAYVATIILNWKEMEFAIIQLLLFVIFIAVDVGNSIYRHITVPNDPVGYMAHLSGGIAGLLVGIFVLRNLEVRAWEKKLWWSSVAIYVVLMLGGISVHIFNPKHFPVDHKYLLH